MNDKIMVFIIIWLFCGFIINPKILDATSENNEYINEITTSININNYERTGFGDVSLSVPYIRQVGDTSDTFDGTTACGATSAVMITAYHNRLPVNPIWCTFCDPDHSSNYGRYVSEIYTIYGYTFDEATPDGSGNLAYGAYGYIHDYSTKNAIPEYARGYFRRHGLYSEVIGLTTNPDESRSPIKNDLKGQIINGRPIWTSTTFWGGHIVVVKGWTDSGNFIVHDPWPEGHDYCYMGNDMIYTWTQMGTSSKWIVTSKPVTSGNKVYVLVDGLKIRDSPSLSGNIIGTVNIGDTGTVVNDVTYGCFYNADEYCWWKVDWDNGPVGWSACGSYGYGANWLSLDIKPPKVDSFSVTPSSIPLGNQFTISYTVSDTGRSGLKQVELWRKSTGDWQQIQVFTIPGSGNGPYYGYFYDAPSAVGIYSYGIHVVDNANNWFLEDTPITVEVTSPSNNPPYTPSNPNPINHQTSVNINADLSWTGGDPDPSDTITYDVYFGTSSNPPKVSTAQSSTSYDPGTMGYNTIYYWKIVSWDNHGASTIGPIWDFTTKVNLQPIFGTPSPANGSTGKQLSLIWGIQINDPEGDTFTWSIQCSNGQFSSGSGTSNGTKSLSISGLTYLTTYKVWVNATDPAGSNKWTRRWYTFTTKANLPPVFGVPTPANNSINNSLSFTWSVGINDPEQNPFTWSIQCSNGQTNSDTGATNGRKSLTLTGLAYSIIYKVWVNATDPTGSGLYTRKWYTFTTQNSPSDVLDQQQTGYNKNIALYSTRWSGQSFIPTLATLTRAEVYIRKAGSPASDVVLSVRSFLTGADLVSVSKPASQISTSFSWVDFDFSDLTITPGTTYYLVLWTTDGTINNCYYWRYGTNTLYTNGMRWYSTNSGVSWTKYAKNDLCFKTYGFT